MSSESNEKPISRLQEIIARSIQEGKMPDVMDFSSIMADFKIQTFDEIGIRKEDLSGKFMRAESAMNYSEDTAGFSYHSELSVNKLGKISHKNDKKQNEESLSKMAERMARILMGNPDGAFSLKAYCCEQSSGSMETRFVISSENLSDEAIEGMIRSVYGRVKTEPIKGRMQSFPEKCYGKAHVIRQSRENLLKCRNDVQLNSWISDLLRSLSCDRNFCAEIQFIPLLEEEEIRDLDERIQMLQDIYNELTFYSETGWNTTVSTGTGINGSSANFLKRMFQGVKEWVSGKEQVNFNMGNSYGLSTKEISKQAQILMEELDYEILRLRQARTSTAWAVRICVSAENDFTLDAVTAILGGFLETSGLGLTWTKEPVTAMVDSSRNLMPLAMFPTAEFPGFEFADNEEYALTSPGSSQDGIHLGNIIWNGERVTDFYLPVEVLNRHAFLCGMTGSGKTNTLFRIIEEINVPFLVIEPVKGEYRALQSCYENVKVWTMRTSDKLSEDTGILRLNPFWFPKTANLTFHIDSIKTILSSAFELTAAMPNILEQCLYNIYVKAGWNLVTNRNMYENELPEEYLYPTFNDLTAEVEDYLDKSDFGSETLGDYKGALLSRLKSFTNGSKGLLLNTSVYPDYQQMTLGCNIIELEGLADDADKCLVMGTVMVQYYEYLKSHLSVNQQGNRLQHIMVIEEAHRLFKNVNKQSKTEGPDTVGQMVESLSNILAEIRAFGEGVLIVDQSPTKIAEDVIKNSGTKIIHRIDNEKDIKVLQAAMLLPEDDNSFPALAQGEAMIRSDAMLRPCKVRVFLSERKENYNLADSFRMGSDVNYELQDMFAATTLLQDFRVRRDAEQCCRRFLDSIAFVEWKDWYEVTHSLMINLMLSLQKYKLTDRLQGQISVLFLLVSMSLKNIYSASNKKQLGYVHMFVMRILELYRDAREGKKVKDKAVDLLMQYAEKFLTADILYTDYETVSEDIAYIQFCEKTQLTGDDKKAMVIFRYYRMLQSIDFRKQELSGIDEGNLAAVFFQKYTLLDVEKYKGVYAEKFSGVACSLKSKTMQETV